MKKTIIIDLFVAAIILANSLALVVSVGIPETGRSRVVFLVSTFLQSAESLAKDALPIRKAKRNSAEENSPGICGIRG